MIEVGHEFLLTGSKMTVKNIERPKEGDAQAYCEGIFGEYGTWFPLNEIPEDGGEIIKPPKPEPPPSFFEYVGQVELEDYYEGVEIVLATEGGAGGPTYWTLQQVFEKEFEGPERDGTTYLGAMRITIEQLEPMKELPPRPERGSRRRALHEDPGKIEAEFKAGIPAPELVPPPESE